MSDIISRGDLDQYSRGSLGATEQNNFLSNAAERGWGGMRRLIDRFGLGYLVFDSKENLVDWNNLARIKLSVASTYQDPVPYLSSSFRQLTRNVRCQLSPNTLTWVVIAHREGTPSIVHEKSDLAPLQQQHRLVDGP